MKIGIQTWGSEGDVRPFLALAGGLAEAGHRVAVVVTEITGKDYCDTGRALNVAVRPAGAVRWGKDRLRRYGPEIVATRDPLLQVRGILRRFFEPLVPEMMAAAKALCRENDLVISHFLVHPLRIMAEKTGTPWMSVFTAPVIPSRHCTPSGAPRWGPIANRVFWKLGELVLNRLFKPSVDQSFRREGLVPAKDLIRDVWMSRLLTLVEASPALFPPPSDWPSHVQVCGFFNMPERGEAWEMPESLRRFLESGPPPVYMTFGSMMFGEPAPADIVELMAAAVGLAGCRAILQADWAFVGGVPDSPNVYRISRAPHQSVFPRCAAVVHHGGSGTTQTATMAGCPSVVVAYATDQLFWGETLFQRGLAPRPLNRRTVTSRKLAEAIRAVLKSPTMTDTARAVGRRIREEKGVARAVRLIEAASRSDFAGV